MKALYFEPPTTARRSASRTIPEELQDEARRYRERLFDVLTEHDEQDRLTSTLLEGGEPSGGERPRRCCASRRSRSTSSRCCAARAASTSASSRCSTRSAGICPARSTGRR